MIKNLDPEHADEPMDFERDLEVKIEQCANYEEEQAFTPGTNLIDDELEMGFSQICTDTSPDKIKNSHSMNITDQQNYTLKKRSKNQKRKLIAASNTTNNQSTQNTNSSTQRQKSRKISQRRAAEERHNNDEKAAKKGAGQQHVNQKTIMIDQVKLKEQ